MKTLLKSIALAVAVVFGTTAGAMEAGPASFAVPGGATGQVLLAPSYGGVAAQPVTVLTQNTTNIGTYVGALGSVPMWSVRPGARFGQVDILLDSYETSMVARKLWGGSVVCWPAAATGLVAGWVGAALAYSLCITKATVCAAQAYYSNPRKRAGMTVTVWGQSWCWKY